MTAYLGNDEFSIFGGLQTKLLGDVVQRNPRISQGDPPDGGLDDVVVEAVDQGEGLVSLKLLGVLLQHFLKSVHIARSHS